MSAEPAAAVIELEGYDLTAVDPAMAAACADGLTRLFTAIDFTVQLLVQRRRLEGGEAEATDPEGHDVGAALRAASAGHVRKALEDTAVFRNRVLVVIPRTGADARTRERRAGQVEEMLHACGLRSRQLDGAAAGPGAGVAAGPVPAERVRSTVSRRGVLTCLEMTRLPGRPVSLGWLAPLLAVATACDVSLHLEPLEPAAAHRSIERHLRGLSADHLLALERGRMGDPRTEAGMEAAEALRDRLARNQVRPVRLSLAVAAAGADEGASTHGAALVHMAAGAAGLRLRRAHLEHAAVARAVAPGGRPHRRGTLIDSAAAATCLPLTEAVCADPGGYRLGFARRSGQPVAVDVFDSVHHSNANVAVFATSGHGKSFTLGLVVMEAVAHGVGALIVDPEGEYERLMHACGGQYLRFGTPGCGALNVFDTAPAPEDAVGTAVDLVSLLCGGQLSELERALVDRGLRSAVAQARAAGRTPLLGDCVAPLAASAPRAAAVLERVCSPPLGEIFNRPSAVDLDGDLCAVSLRDLPSEFVPAATLLIASWMWTRVRLRRRRQHIVLDEVGALCVHPPLRDLLVQLARRCRKYGASLVVATQNVEDLLRTDEGSVVATNCAVVLLGGHRAAEAAHMERAFGLTGGQRRFLEHAGRGEFLLLAGRRRVEVRVDVPALHRSVLER